VANLIKSWKYGKVIRATVQFEHGEVFGPKKGWMFNHRLSGGGVLMNPGPHVFSIIHLIFGSPSSVNAKLEDLYIKGIDDKVKAVLRYHNFDVIANLSWSVPNKHVSETKLVVYLNKGRITCDGQKIVIKSLQKKVVINSSDLTDHGALNLNPKAYGDAYYREDIEFIQAIEGHRTPSFNTLDSAIKIENVIHQIYKKGQQ
jgi:predicted dehydrogenase